MPDSRPTFYGLFRESNAVPLQVLAPPILAGLPLELDVYDGASPATMLATLEAARDASFVTVKDDVGSGQFVLPADDPKAVHLQRGNIVKFKLGGVYRFAIVLDEPKLIPAAEGAAARYEVGGQGVGIMLDRAVLYSELSFSSTSLGAILHAVVDAQLAKTPSPLPHVTVDFTALVDSDGANWADTATLGLSKGASSLDVWKQLTSLGLDSRMTHTLKLQAYNELGVHRDGTSSSDPVVLRQGRHFAIDPELVGRGGGMRSRVLVIGEGGASFEVIDPAIEANPKIGRRETALSFGSADPTTMQRAGEALLESLQLESQALKLPVVHGLDPGDYEPWVDYDVGDWVLIDIPGKLELVPHRIVGMQVDQGETPFDWGLTLDLNSYSLEADLRLKRQLDALGGSQVSGGGVSNVSLGGSNVSGTSTSGKVSVEQGDTPGYLYSKTDVVSPLVKSLVGSASNRQMRLAFAGQLLTDLLDVDATGIVDGDALVYDSASGLFVPGAVGGGGGGGTVRDRRWTPGPGQTSIDEFDNDVIDPAWVRVDAAGAAGRVTLAEGASSLSILHAGGDPAAHLHGLVRPLPTAFVAGDALEAHIGFHGDVTINYAGLVGIVLSDGATHGAGSQMIALTWLDTNGWLNQNARSFTNWVTNGTDGVPMRGPKPLPVYSRLVYLGGNVWRHDGSIDGILWRKSATITVAMPTLTHYGFVVTSWGSAQGWQGSIEYLRRVAGVS